MRNALHTRPGLRVIRRRRHIRGRWGGFRRNLALLGHRPHAICVRKVVILDQPGLQFCKGGRVAGAHQFFVDDASDQALVLDSGHGVVGLLEISSPNRGESRGVG